MEYFLSEEQLIIKELAKKIAKEKIAPIAQKYDEDQAFPDEAIKILADSDIFGIYIEEKYGGLGGGILEMSLVVEELSKACGGIALSFAGTALGAFPIVLFGSDEQRQKYLPEIASGKKLSAFGLTEANAGSDAAGIQTSAALDGNEYVLNGTKQWITNGGDADIYTVIACTDRQKGARGFSAFIVEKGMPGFSFGKKENKMGIRASTTRELVFDNCRIPKENLLSKEGIGFIVAMKTLDRTRPGVAAQALGIAQGAFDEALAYSKERVQFGQPISSFQAIQHMLADMAIQIEAARCLVYQTCRHIDSGTKNISKESAMAKVMASDVAMKVTVDAVQILGGYGYMKEYPVEKMMRDAKITQIYEGTNQIQRNVIALELIKELSKK
ncbi:alkylation response protein AidB-like acyl-CoA dehydrogenase [Anaerobacterium chartisolvens]|uniref:Alkylation response protein AidB-like acyl-CoA dehydrogenase n=1 Tax=Anaerobacterium chartisolvens TaxID=1297424 RepID=A0A369B729_9FIRM|nr:acyl-CoA dehydrogenase family protein [Anaerobacterium chartisolvens]RCX16337.1 alkylation response protein AidB-like acyl-CoA dehydrogenase [Anaerobacterium chartisolvens]